MTRSRLTQLRLTGDVGAIAIALYIAFLLRFRYEVLSFTEVDVPVSGYHLMASGVWLAALLMFLILNRLYDEDTLFDGGGEAARIGRSVLEAIAVLATFVFLTQTFAISRSWFSFTVLFSLIMLAVWRRTLRHIMQRQRARRRWRRPVAILHDEEVVAPLSSLEGVDEFDVIGTMVASEFLKAASEGRPFARGTVLLIEARHLEESELWKIVLAAGALGCPTFIEGASRTVSRDRMTVREVGERTIIKVAPPKLAGLRAIQKRAFDLVGSIMLLAFLSPLLIVISASILLTSGRPILFRQQRVGLNGRRFHMLKFRTMVRDAEVEGPRQTSPTDPRRTRLGTILRRFSLDELPQLWNVLLGHMSLVGPRPEQPSFAERFSGELLWYRYRHRIRPGLTGLSQSRGLRGHTSIASRVELDNRYIEHWSLWLDIRIMLASVREIFFSRNAY